MSTSGRASPTLKQKATSFGQKAWSTSYKISDKLAVYANMGAAKVGSEAFWPAAGDTPKEIEKCARILTDFTSKGVEETITKEVVDPQTGEKVKKQKKVLKKIPPAVIKQAKGLLIFTAFRTGIAPLGGAGGCGMVIARLPDGSWSAPSSVMPQNLSAGLMFGLDIYDVVLVVRTEKAMQSFYGHKFSLGAELAVVAGPVGAGAALDTGKEMVPCWSYVKSRGFYAGVEMAGTIMISRYDEMARFYYTPGIRAGDILTGKVRMPVEAKTLHDAIAMAEDLADTDAYQSKADANDGLVIDVDGLDLDENETLHLPPTPAQLAMEEGVTFQESWALQEAEAAKNPDDELVYKRDLSKSMGPPPLPSRAARPPPQASEDARRPANSRLAAPPLVARDSDDSSAHGGEVPNTAQASNMAAPQEDVRAAAAAPPPVPQRRRPVGAAGASTLSRQNSGASLHERIQMRRQNSMHGQAAPTGLVRQNSQSGIHSPMLRRQESFSESPRTPYEQASASNNGDYFGAAAPTSPIASQQLRRQDSTSSIKGLTSRLDSIGT